MQNIYNWHRCHFWRQLMPLLSLFLVTTTLAQVNDIAPKTPPVAQAHALETAPTLDGKILDDPAWQSVVPVTGFWQTRPNEGRAATQTTQVYIGFTETALFIGAVLLDDNPESIIVSDSRRDASLEETDSFQVIIDSFLDRQNGFIFGTNPAGIQYDGQVTKEGTSVFGSGGGGFNLDWDTTWDVRTSVTDKGWNVEMEIPFKSLRYAGDEKPVWGINFQRNIRRNKEVAYWSPLPRQHNLYRTSEAGTLEGLNVPVQRNLKVTPYALAQVLRSDEIQGSENNEEFGFDVKYSITPSLTLDATYNTDFAQVEVDEVVVNLDRFSVFLPEKRPFFLENAGQFSMGSPEEVELFFSRRIGISNEGTRLPIEGGLRLSGKIGDSTNVGLLHMSSDAVSGEAPSNDFSVVRVNQELENRSSLGLIYVQREGDGSYGVVNKDDDYNRTYGIDGRWGIGDEILISSYLAKTDTSDLNGKDHAMQIKADYNSERWFNSIGYSEVGEDFNPEVGFVSRKDYRKGNFLIYHRYRPEDLWGLQELRPHISYSGYWDFDGNYESGFVHVDNHWEFKTGLEFHTGMNFIHEEVQEAFDIVDGATVQPGRYDNKELALVFFTNQGAPLSFRLDVKSGGFFSGDKLSLSPKLKYRIGESFNSELSWQYNNIDLEGAEGSFDINVGILKLAYSFNPKTSLEVLVQYDDRRDSTATNVRFAWLQSANAGLYLVYNEVDIEELGIGRHSKKFILKYSYIFDVL